MHFETLQKCVHVVIKNQNNLTIKNETQRISLSYLKSKNRIEKYASTLFDH